MDTQETTIFTAILISSFFLSIIIVYFVISIIRQQRRNLELSRQNILSEIAAMEKERGRLAADLHDDLGPLLSVIKFQIDTVEVKAIKDEQQLQSASHQLDHLMDRLRDISYNLLPTVLLRQGLPTSIDEFLGRLEGATGLKTEFICEGFTQLTEEESINIFRVVQEVLHNVVKHAGASKVSVRLQQDKQQVSLLIKDNGRGFNYEEASRSSSGIGLRSIKSRIDVLKGSIRVESQENVGTAYLFVIPFTKA